MTSQDNNQVSMKSNMFGFGGYSQMKFWKCHKLDNFWVWFVLVMSWLSLWLGLDPFWFKTFVPISKITPFYQLNFSSFVTSETGNIDCTDDINYQNRSQINMKYMLLPNQTKPVHFWRFYRFCKTPFVNNP